MRFYTLTVLGLLWAFVGPVFGTGQTFTVTMTHFKVSGQKLVNTMTITGVGAQPVNTLVGVPAAGPPQNVPWLSGTPVGGTFTATFTDPPDIPVSASETLTISIGNATLPPMPYPTGATIVTVMAKAPPNVQQQGRLNKLPLDDSYGHLSSYQGSIYGTLFLRNSSSKNYGYALYFQIYHGLNPVYFGTDEFDSPEAISTGRFLYDTFDDLEGLLYLAPNLPDYDPTLALTRRLELSSNYVLVIGFAWPILGPGELGDPVPFSMALAAGL